MKIRRITLGILLLLTLLSIADLRYFGGDESSYRRRSIHFQVDPNPMKDMVEKKQDFLRPQGQLTSLVIKGKHGSVDLRSVESDQIKVNTIVMAADERALERLEVVESVSDSEISYDLSGDVAGGLRDVGVSYTVDVPAGMDVVVVQQYGTVKVEDFVGFLDIEARFATVEVRGLQGSATVRNYFGTVNLREMAGPLMLEDSYSMSRVNLLPIAGGYDFAIDVTNGTLGGNAPFKTERLQNTTTAKGQTGEGLHPIVVKSNFGTVIVDLDN